MLEVNLRPSINDHASSVDTAWIDEVNSSLRGSQHIELSDLKKLLLNRAFLDIPLQIELMALRRINEQFNLSPPDIDFRAIRIPILATLEYEIFGVDAHSVVTDYQSDQHTEVLGPIWSNPDVPINLERFAEIGMASVLYFKATDYFAYTDHRRRTYERRFRLNQSDIARRAAEKAGKEGSQLKLLEKAASDALSINLKEDEPEPGDHPNWYTVFRHFVREYPSVSSLQRKSEIALEELSFVNQPYIDWNQARDYLIPAQTYRGGLLIPVASEEDRED